MDVKDDWWVTPKRRLKDIPKSLTLDDKVDIFSERINGWKIEIADYLINGRIIKNEKSSFTIEGNPHASYATLDIILSYFEMIAKYYEGYTGTLSEPYFKKGVRLVYPETKDINKEKVKSLLEELLDTLYHGARCGTYHIGFPDSRIFLADGETDSIKFHSNGKVTINPHKLVKVVSYHFNNYIKQLKDTRNTELRQNFEKRFDMDTSYVATKHF